MKYVLEKVRRGTGMPFLSAGKGYIFSSSDKRRWILKALGLSGGADIKDYLENLG
jgi:hypothetical protein